MSKKKDIWNLVILNLKSKLSKPDYSTWFSQTTLKELDSNAAVIGVPNKFVSNWLQEKFLIEIKKSFKRVLKQAPPDIYFSYEHPSQRRKPTQPYPVNTSDFYSHHLNPSMTFDRFIVGKGNKFASSSALEVASGHATDYNPLYIYGQSGVGKTHLLHAIGNYTLERDPYAKIRYLSTETFTSDFTYSIKNKKVHEFREKYSHLDLFLFDDVQLMDNRRKTQEEFLSIFNAIYGAKHQVVVAGHKPPNELKNINSQLKSRLGSGLLTKIQIPDQNTKIAIIRDATNSDNFYLPDDVVFFLAKTNNDIKTLINNIVRIKTYGSLTQGDMSISLVKSIMKDRAKADIGIDEIKSIVAGYFNISVTDLISKKKKRSYAYPRQIAMYLSRKYTNKSFKAIGTSFGQKDHSTVIYAVRRIEESMAKDERISDDLENIENLIG